MIALEHENVLPVLYGDEEVHDLRILHTSVYVITDKYVELIILYSAILIQILHKRRVAAVHVTYVVDSLIL